MHVLRTSGSFLILEGLTSAFLLKDFIVIIDCSKSTSRTCWTANMFLDLSNLGPKWLPTSMLILQSILVDSQLSKTKISKDCNQDSSNYCRSKEEVIRGEIAPIEQEIKHLNSKLSVRRIAKGDVQVLGLLQHCSLMTECSKSILSMIVTAKPKSKTRSAEILHS